MSEPDLARARFGRALIHGGSPTSTDASSVEGRERAGQPPLPPDKRSRRLRLALTLNAVAVFPMTPSVTHRGPGAMPASASEPAARATRSVAQQSPGPAEMHGSGSRLRGAPQPPPVGARPRPPFGAHYNEWAFPPRGRRACRGRYVYRRFHRSPNQKTVMVVARAPAATPPNCGCVRRPSTPNEGGAREPQSRVRLGLPHVMQRRRPSPPGATLCASRRFPPERCLEWLSWTEPPTRERRTGPAHRIACCASHSSRRIEYISESRHPSRSRAECRIVPSKRKPTRRSTEAEAVLRWSHVYCTSSTLE